jgi:hypothetical protein
MRIGIIIWYHENIRIAWEVEWLSDTMRMILTMFLPWWWWEWYARNELCLQGDKFWNGVGLSTLDYFATCMRQQLFLLCNLFFFLFSFFFWHKWKELSVHRITKIQPNHNILEPTMGITFFNSGSKSDPTELFPSIVQVIGG